jgi:flavin-dependent dehydrogenase
MSIGMVCRPEYLKTRQNSLDDFLMDTLNGIAETHERMAAATIEMPARATGNYSYLSDRMLGPGYLMIGDAYAFIDPVFSSGVYLAMSSAEQGVAVAEAWLSGDKPAYRKACRRYQKYILKGLSSFSWFIVRFTSPAMRLLMSNPRRESKVVRAVISMLAGDVYSSKEIRFRLLAFKAIYAASWLFQLRESITDWRKRQRSNRAADLRS